MTDLRPLLIAAGLATAACVGVIDQDPTGTATPGADPQTVDPSATGAPAPAGTPGPAPTPGAAVTAATSPCAVPPRIVRLTDEQYGRAVADLLPGVAVGAIRTPGGNENEFPGGGDGLAIDGRLASQIQQSAAGVAAEVARNPRLAVTCRVGEDERACARGFIERFAARAFRRPVQAGERDRLLSLYDLGRPEGFGAGLALVVEATLQSADFLYRTELGEGDPTSRPGAVLLSAHERAAALSFFLLDSVPDDELWRAAGTGALASPRELEAQVARLLGLPRVQDHLGAVVSRWFGVHRVLTAETATTGFDQTLRRSMHDEARRFLHAVLWKGGTIRDLYTSRQAFVDARMAQIYGVASASTAGEPRTLAPDRWSGILTRPGFVAGLPAGNRSVFRGLFIRAHVLCGRLAPPPPNLDETALARLAAARSEREKVKVRAETASCAGCHALMDPLGLALEHYDDTGRYVTSREGAPVDASGTLIGSDVEGPFRNGVELGEMLGRSADVAACVLAHLASAATLRSPDDMFACQTPGPGRAATPDSKLAALVQAIATGPLLRERIAAGAQP